VKEILRGSFIIFVFKVFGAFSLFLTYIFIPRYYGIETFGVFNLILALLMIATVLSRIGLDTYVVRVLSSVEDKKREISLFLKEVLKILIVSSLLVTLMVLIGLDFINDYFFKSIDASNYLIGLAFIILPYTLFNVLVEILRGLDDIKIYSFFRNFSQNFAILLLVGISIVTLKMYHPVYILYTAILIITVLLILVLYKILKIKNINVLQKGKYEKKILKHSYPMLLAASIIFLTSYIDSFMISYYLDEYQVGIYNACISLSMIIAFIPMAIGGYISPKISKAYSNNNRALIKELFKNSMTIILIVTLPIFLTMYFFSTFFLSLFGEAFTQATTTLLIINIAFLLEAIFGFVGFILNMTDNQHIFMKTLFISLIINVVFNALLIPIYGINGAAVAMVFSIAFWAITSFIILKRKEII
jgi:O-antigen/teichoic acid export membrane protein